MSQKSAKSAAGAELHEHPGCECTGWDAALVGDRSRLNVECKARLAEITNRLRQKFDLAG